MSNNKFSIDDLLLNLANRISPTPEESVIQSYLGKFTTCYLGYASNEAFRSSAASGGVVSTVLIYLLENKVIDGALISRLLVKDNQIIAEPFIARSKQEILSGQSSIYMEVPMMNKLRELKNISGNLAIVALPCHLSVLQQYISRDAELEKRIKLRIGLVCARNSKKQLLLEVLKKKGIREENISEMKFRQGHWRGEMQIGAKNGEQVKFPFQDFSLYRNLHFECEMKCLHCEDPLANHADLVCGDGWLPELKKHPIKHSLCISRNTKTSSLINQMILDDFLIMEQISPELFFSAQRRTIIPMKRGKSAKINLSRFLGFKMKSTVSPKSHWNDYIVAFMILLNYKMTNSKSLNKVIFKIPKPFLRIYLFVMSFLKNF